MSFSILCIPENGLITEVLNLHVLIPILLSSRFLVILECLYRHKNLSIVDF